MKSDHFEGRHYYQKKIKNFKHANLTYMTGNMELYTLEKINTKVPLYLFLDF